MSKKFKKGSKVVLTDNAYFWSNGAIIPDWVRSLGYLYVMSSENGYSVITCDENLIIQTGTISNDCLKPYLFPKKIKNNNDVNIYVYEGGDTSNANRRYTDILIVKEGVKVIPEQAFSHWENLQLVILPESLSAIECHAFSCCRSLKSIYIPDSVKYIKGDAFSNCEKLKKIHLPKSLRYVGKCAFMGTRLKLRLNVKSTDQHMICRNFKYKLGQWYHEYCIKLCRSGFHYCKNAFDAFNYYYGKYASEFRLFKVSVKKVSHDSDYDSKRVCGEICLKKEITLSDFVNMVNKKFRVKKPNLKKYGIESHEE